VEEVTATGSERTSNPVPARTQSTAKPTSPEDVQHLFDALIDDIKVFGRDTSSIDATRARIHRRFKRTRRSA
jgi:hypothetical protein